MADLLPDDLTSNVLSTPTFETKDAPPAGYRQLQAEQGFGRELPVPSTVDQMFDDQDPSVPVEIADPDNPRQFKPRHDAVVPEVRNDPAQTWDQWGQKWNNYSDEVAKSVAKGAGSTAVTAIVGLGTDMVNLEANLPQEKIDRSLVSVLEHAIEEKDPVKRKEIQANMRQAIPSLFSNVIDRQNAQRLISDAFEDPANLKYVKDELGKIVDPFDDSRFKAVFATQAWIDETFKPSPEFANTWSDKIAGGTGSVVTFLASSYFGGPAVGYSMGALSGQGEAFQNALQNGAAPDVAFKAALLGTIPGLTENVPIEVLLKNPKMTNVLFGIALNVGRQVVIEGGQEALQQLMQNAIAKYLYKPDQQLSEGVGESALVGGIVGGGVGAGVDLIELRGRYYDEKTIKALNDAWDKAQASGGQLELPEANPAAGTPADLNGNPLPPSVRAALEPARPEPEPKEGEPAKPAPEEPVAPETGTPERRLSDVAPGSPLHPEDQPGRIQIEEEVKQAVARGSGSTASEPARKVLAQLSLEDQVAINLARVRQSAGREIPPESVAALDKLSDAIDQVIVSREASQMAQTPAFKAWFAGSSVVDEKGQPRVLYHGTEVSFGEFKITGDVGFHFGTRETALDRAASGDGANVMPVFLSIRNPLRLPDLGSWTAGDVAAALREKGLITPEEMAAVENGKALVDREWMKEKLARAGYDGIVYLNRGEGFDTTKIKEEDGSEDYHRSIGAQDSYIALEPTQIKSIFNEGTYDPQDPDISKLSVPLRTGEEDLSEFGVSPGDKVKVRELAAALEARQRSQFGKIELDDYSDAAKEKLADWLATEVQFELQPGNIDKSAYGWYTDKFQRALDTFGAKYPELMDEDAAKRLNNRTAIRSKQDARDLMTALFAITSDGQRVNENFKSADRVYAAYREEGRMPATVEGARGDRSASMTKNLLKIQKLIDDLGIEGMVRFLLTERQVSDINAELRRQGRGDEVKSKLPASAVMPQAAVEFGPKLGAFYANLMGTQGYLTMDMWWARTFNRLRGTLLTKPSEAGIQRVGQLAMRDRGLKKMPSRKKLLEIATEEAERYKSKGFKNGTELEVAANTVYKDAFVNLEEQPLGANDRAFMIATAKATQEKLRARGHQLTIADIQALIWYYEKRLYGELGAKQSDDISYEEAAQRAVAGAGADLRQPGSADDRAREDDAARERAARPVPRSIGERLANVRSSIDAVRSQGAEAGAGGKVWSDGRPSDRPGAGTDLTYEPTPAAAEILRQRDVPIAAIVEHDADHAPAFHKAISDMKAASRYGAAVYVYPVEEYAQMRLFTTKDGRSGFAIKSDGDIVSVFSDGSGLGPMMVQLAVEQGGTKLDAFDTVLPQIYSAVGFVEVKREPWNDEYRPDGWDERTFAAFNNGKPDVVFMEYRPPATVSRELLAPLADGDVSQMRVQAPRGLHPLERGRPKGGIADVGKEPTLSKQEIARLFDKALRLTVEQGRFGRGNSDAAAIYKWSQSVARISDQGDLVSRFHEGGHHIHAMMGRLLDNIIRQHQAEIHNVAMKYYGSGGQIQPGDVKKLELEGFATFFQVWMNNPQAAQVIAPGFKQSFEALLNQKAPELHAAMKMLQDAVDKLVTEKSSLELLGDRFKPLRKVTTVDQIRTSVKEGTFLHDVGTLANRIYQMGFDQDHPLTMTMRRLKIIAEDNVRRLMDRGALDKAGAARVLEQLDKRGRANPIKMMWMAKNSHNISTEMLASGVPEYNGNGDPVTLGIPAILAIAQGSAKGRLDPKVYEDFNKYAGGRRIIQEWDNYNETRKWEAAKERGVKYPEPRTKRYRQPDDLRLDDTIKAVTELHKKYPNFDRAVQELYKFQNALLKYRFDAGDLTQEQFDYMSGMQNYVPLRRDMGDADSLASVGQGKTKDQRTGKDDLIRVFKGSSRPIINPVDAIMQSVHEQIALTHHNQVKRSLVDVALDVGMNSGAVVEKIPATQLQGTNVRLADVLKAAGDFSLAEEIANAMGRDEISMQEFLEEFLDGDETATIWRSTDIKEKGEKIIYVRRDGKIEAYKLNDPEWGSDLYNTLTELGREQSNLLINILGKPAAFLRAGVTTAPPFLIANIVRDQLSAWILNDGVFPVAAAARGFKQDMFDRRARRLYNLSGAAIGGSNVAALDKTRIGTEQTRLAKLGVGVTLEASLGTARRLIDSSETWTRQGIWYAAFKKAKADGLSDGDAMAEAGFEASDYANYGRAGSKMLTARRLITFLNANLQGLDKGFRTMLGGEGGAALLRKQLRPWAARTFNTSGTKVSLPLTPQEKLQVQKGLRTMTKMMSLALVSALLAALYWDDEEYDTMNPYLKGTRWMVKLAPGQWLAIPKPFQLAMFATMTEYAIDGILKDDPTALSNFLKSQTAVLVPPYENPAIRLAYETATNTNLFTGAPIVAPEVAGMPAWLQYNQYTSELGKGIGRLTGASPMLVDHYITSSFATWGRGALSLSNMTNPNRPQQGWDDFAFTSYFLKNGSRSSTARPAFWYLMALRSGELTGYAQGYKKLMDAGANGQAQEFLSRLSEDGRVFAELYYDANDKWGVAGKKLHPMRNAYDVATVISGIRKEIALNQFKADKGEGAPIVLSPEKQKLLMDRLGDLSTREMRNALVLMNEPGWGQRDILPTMPIFEQIKAIDPQTAIELKKRMTGKVYTFDAVRKLWPSVRTEILTNGADANLRPQINQAKFSGTKFFTDGSEQ